MKYNYIYILRLIHLPFGLFIALFRLANNAARDMQNRKRFRYAKIDNDTAISPGCKIGRAHILGNCTLNNVEVGDYTYISPRALIQNTKIGRYCSISTDLICGLGRHPLDMLSTSPLFYRSKNTFHISIVDNREDFPDYLPIEIGNDVWIGARVTIMDGCKIGNGAVIAAGAIVTKDVPDFAIVAGIPAKIIRYREMAIRHTQSVGEWWTKEPKEVVEIINSLQNNANIQSAPES